MSAKARQIRGLWYVVTHNKGHRLPKKCFGKDRAAATEAARQINITIKLGELGIQPKVEPLTLRQFGDEYMERPSETPRKPTTVKQYKRFLRVHIYPVLGAKKVGDITRDDVLNF